MKNSDQLLRTKWEILELADEGFEPLYGFTWRINSIFPLMNIGEKYTLLWNAIEELNNGSYIEFYKFEENEHIKFNNHEAMKLLNSPYIWTHSLKKIEQIFVRTTPAGLEESHKLIKLIKF